MLTNRFKSLRDYEIFYDQSPVPIFQINRDGKVSHCNPAACNLFGYHLDEFKELTFDQITVASYLPADRHHFLDLLEGKIEKYDMVKGYRTKSGLQFIQHLYVYAVRNENGELDHVMSMVLPATGHTTRVWNMASRNMKTISRIIGAAIAIALTILIKVIFDIDITELIK